MTLKQIQAGVYRRLTSLNTPPVSARRACHTAVALALLAVMAVMQAGLANAAGPRDSGSQPAVQSLPDTGQYGLGFVPDPAAVSSARVAVASPLALPASVDLSKYNPPVGNQGGVESCVAWATGYYLRGWYARRDGYYPAGGSDGAGSYEPMYTYAQLVKGVNKGTTFAHNLNIQQSQGIDTRADYSQGDYDYTDQPTIAESANAAFVRIASYNDVGNGGGTSLQNWIESSLASGNPVAVGIPVYPEFDHVSSLTGYVVYPPLPGETSRGGHAVFAYKYDATGLWIKNSWGKGWGTSGDGDPNKGSAELSWSFVNQDAFEAVNIVPVGTGLVSGYVWANNPISPSYTPSAAYQFNSSGATNTISRGGIGVYTVTFPNLGVNGGTALATAYGPGNATCKVAFWFPVGTALDVNVRCFNVDGASVDTTFTLAFDRPQSAANPLAYLWANLPSAASYTPSLPYQFNSSGAANTITRVGTGSYAVLLPNLGGPFGHAQVTAYGTGSERCKVVNWGPSGTAQQVNVNCFNSAGVPADSMFTLTYVRSASLDGGPAASSAYLWANLPSAASYTPSLPYQFNSSGLTNTIFRLGTGSYAARLPGQNLNVGDVQVTAYGPGADTCKVVGWSPVGGVVVNCFDSSGAAADSYYDLSFVNA